MLSEYAVLGQQYQNAVDASRPFILIKPKIFQEGLRWCALYGDSIQEGVCGFGDTPEEASFDFDKNWCRKRTCDYERLNKNKE